MDRIYRIVGDQTKRNNETTQHTTEQRKTRQRKTTQNRTEQKQNTRYIKNSTRGQYGRNKQNRTQETY